MTRQELEDTLKSDWEAVVSFFHNLFNKSSVTVQTPDNAQHPAPESPPPPVEAPSPVANPATNVAPVATPSVTDLLFGKPSGEAAPQAPAQPAVDTSAPTLDFNVVGNGVPINLTGPKTIVNCPASVVVQVQQASGQSGASNTYTATVNGIAAFCPNVQAQLTVSAQGPVVTVSVDCPGLQMEIRG